MPDNIPDLISRARTAQREVDFWPQELVDDMVTSAGWEVYRCEHAEACARLAVEETVMGVYEHKVAKQQKKILGTLRDLHGLKTVGVIEEDRARGLMKIAKPVGVIGALTPMTNATSTICCNGLSMLKTRNAVIFAPHPRAKRSCKLTADFMRAGLEKAGAPPNLIQYIEEPSLEITNELMKSVDLVVATGGTPMVKAAYSSGTPAYGVGSGNSVCIVDETADIADAAHKIFLSKTFDNATSCSTENSGVFQEAIFDRMVAALIREGGYLCTMEEKAKLKVVMWPDGSHLNPRIVGQHAKVIADLAGIPIPESTSFLMVMGEQIGPGDPFSGEKISPVITLWKFNAFDEAINYVNEITAYSGRGHSCGIHTTREERVAELGLKALVTRIMVRQPQCYANSGDYVNGMPFSLTLGCGTWGGNIASENITWKHFINTTWVSSPIEPVIPKEEEIFGAHWKKHGRG